MNLCIHLTWTLNTANGMLFSLFIWNTLSTSHWLIELLLTKLHFYKFECLFNSVYVYLLIFLYMFSYLFLSSDFHWVCNLCFILFFFFFPNENDFLFSLTPLQKQSDFVELNISMFFLDSLRYILLVYVIFSYLIINTFRFNLFFKSFLIWMFHLYRSQWSNQQL